MKKFLVFAVVLALLVPAAAFAATEFSLGGFVKLDAMWDSNAAVGKNINAAPARNTDCQHQPWASEVYGPGLPVQLHHQGTEPLGRQHHRLHGNGL